MTGMSYFEKEVFATRSWSLTVSGLCMFNSLLLPLQGPEQNALGNVLVVCLLAGIFSGVVLDWMWLIGKGW